MSSWFSYYQRWCSIVLLVYQMGHDIQYMFIHWEINPLRLDDKYGLSFRLWVFVILFQMLGTQLDWCWERERELKYYLVSTYLSIYTFKKTWDYYDHIISSFLYVFICMNDISFCVFCHMLPDNIKWHRKWPMYLLQVQWSVSMEQISHWPLGWCLPVMFVASILLGWI